MEERYEGKSIGLVARYVLGTMQDFGGKIFSAHAGRSGKSQQFDDIADLSSGVWRRNRCLQMYLVWAY